MTTFILIWKLYDRLCYNKNIINVYVVIVKFHILCFGVRIIFLFLTIKVMATLLHIGRLYKKLYYNNRSEYASVGIIQFHVWCIDLLLIFLFEISGNIQLDMLSVVKKFVFYTIGNTILLGSIVVKFCISPIAWQYVEFL